MLTSGVGGSHGEVSVRGTSGQILAVLVVLTVGCVTTESASRPQRQATSTKVFTTTVPPTVPAPTIPVTSAPPVPATRAASAPSTQVVPPEGRAAAWGCDAALAYLRAYADPIFGIECPGYAYGKAAITCFGGWSGADACAPNQFLIVVEVPCPVAYMNEASNSWVVAAEAGAASDPSKATAHLDPFGSC